jgi:hypothetical protein
MEEVFIKIELYNFYDHLNSIYFKAPTEKMAAVLNKTIKDVKERISKDLVQKDCSLNQQKIQECIDELRGAVTIVYPMGLPPHDPIQMELENKEDLEGTQVIELYPRIIASFVSKR